MKPTIEVNSLSKSYIINHKNKASYSTLKDDFNKLVRHPFKKDGSFDKQENFWALKDVSFTVNPGEIFGIIGRNGSGKSTLLKILSRIVEPTSGYAKLHGRTASLLEVGTGFNPELTGRENIFFNGSMLGMSRRDIHNRFQQIVDFSEVEKFLDTPVKFYSSGMYVRLAFSVAAHLEPDILILDEVLSVGDAGFQKKSLNKIMESMRAGRTVIFVSHSMGSVQQLCSRGMLLNNGHVEYVGGVGELTERYMTLMRGEEPETALLSASWENDGSFDSDYFYPSKMYITDGNNKLMRKPVTNNKDHYLHIEGKVKKTDKLLTIGFGLYNEAKTLMYMSYPSDIAEKFSAILPEGDVHLKAKLPAHYVNAGGYRVSMIGGLHNKAWLFEPGGKVPHIEWRIDGGLSESPYWTQPREGSMAPLIEWHIN